MRKPEIEIVKFDSSDVIATSGKSYSLTVSKYKDRQANNLTVNFNEKEYKSYDSLSTALGAAGLDETTNTSAGSGGKKNFYTYFDYDSLDGSGFHDLLNGGVNGTYTWFDKEKIWKHD